MSEAEVVDFEQALESQSNIDKLLAPLPPHLQKILAGHKDHESDMDHEIPVDMSEDDLEILEQNGYANVERRGTTSGELVRLHYTQYGAIAMEGSFRRWYGPDYYS